MLTVFSILKPCDGAMSLIQRRAVESWAALSPKPEIILFGDRDARDLAQSCGASLVESFPKNRFGTPLIDGVFAEAARRSQNGFLCYVNADIILAQGVMDALLATSSSTDGGFLICPPPLGPS